MQIYSCFLGLLTCCNVFMVLSSNSKVINPSDLIETFFFLVILPVCQLIKKLESSDTVGEKLVRV